MTDESKKEDLSWLVVGGFMFVGIGLGMAFGDKQVGTMLGLGVGLIVKVFYPNCCSKK